SERTAFREAGRAVVAAGIDWTPAEVRIRGEGTGTLTMEPLLERYSTPYLLKSLTFVVAGPVAGVLRFEGLEGPTDRRRPAVDNPGQLLVSVELRQRRRVPHSDTGAAEYLAAQVCRLRELSHLGLWEDGPGAPLVFRGKLTPRAWIESGLRLRPVRRADLLA